MCLMDFNGINYVLWILMGLIMCLMDFNGINYVFSGF